MDEARDIGSAGIVPLMRTMMRIDLAAVSCLRIAPDGSRDIARGSVCGWAVGPEPLARIDVLLGDRFVTTARLGNARPDIATLFPGIAHAGQAGFEATLTSGRLQPGPSTVVLRLQTVAGRNLTITYPLTVLDGSTEPGALPIRMAVDECAVDASGHLHVSGWALAEAPIAAIQVFVGGEHLATTLPSHARPDVAALFPGYGDAWRCGFTLVRPLRREARALEPIRIEAIARDGSAHAMVVPAHFGTMRGSEPPAQRALAPAPPRHDPQLQFHCDSIAISIGGGIRIEGWAAARTGISGIAVTLDGTLVGNARLGLPRPDVGRAFPRLPGSPLAGFAFDVAMPALQGGEHAIGFIVALDDGTRHSFLETAQASGRDEDRIIDQTGDVRLAVDGMRIVAGHATRRIGGAFHLVGWAAARAGIAAVEVFLDENSLGRAYHGLRREDVAAAFPQLPGSLLTGFALSVPARALKQGRVQFRIVATARNGAQAQTGFSADIDLSLRGDTAPTLRQRISAAELATHRAILAARGPLPVCDLAMRAPAGRDTGQAALATLASLASQGYEAWRLWLHAAAGADGAALRRTLQAACPDHADRIHLLQDYAPATGSILAGLLLAGDVIASDGLLALALAASGPQAGVLVYGDDLRADFGAPQPAAFFKPGWSPDLLLSQNYIGRAWLVGGSAMARAGVDLRDMAAAGPYGALLRLTEVATTIRHVPQLILKAARSQAARGSERRALSQALRRRGLAGSVEAGRIPGLHRIRRATACAKVSIIIPTIAAKGHIRACIASIRRLTKGIEYEIILVDNLRGRSPTPQQREWKAWFRANADVVVAADEAFNWSRLNNRGAAAASGDHLLFLNDDIEVQSEDWLAVLAAEAARPEVGVVGAQLLYPDGKVQHAGIILSRGQVGRARHAFRFADRDDPGYFGLALSQRNVACVTGACMMMRKDVFAAAGGFDEAHGVVNNDVDFCLRLHSAGKLVVYTPHVQLIHHELASRAELKDSYDEAAFYERWGGLCLEGDPFYNPNLSAEAGDHTVDEEPLREVYPGHPLGRRDRIKRILAVKLDHIGDLVTALPALRRLKAHFPQARLDALIGPSGIGIARLETAIDAFIPFGFFEARSSLGRKTLRKREYAALEAQLKAGRYDLAVDLRKLGDTRHILQLTHAPLLAGFDHDGGFPWLDIALEWEGDALQARRRSHVADDLLNLADAVGNAFDENRHTLGPIDALPALSAELARDFAGLFARDFVVVHPAAGAALRQWPPAYFARLIDLLAARDGMRVALIGGSDERAIAGEVLAGVTQKDAVFDLVGRSRLDELPELLSRSALFVGNNSGPSHIAAGLGVPTVAVHSAIVASEEWAPLGPAAVALRRDMSCAPCYLVNVDQCHRDLACLTSLTPHAVHRLCQRFLSLRAGSQLKTADPRANEDPHGCDA